MRRGRSATKICDENRVEFNSRLNRVLTIFVAGYRSLRDVARILVPERGCPQPQQLEERRTPKNCGACLLPRAAAEDSRAPEIVERRAQPER